MKSAMSRMIIAAAVLAMSVALFQGCAASKLPRHAEDALRISQKGLAVVVDSSLTAPQHSSKPWISVPDNGSIAVELQKAADSVLASKGYRVEPPVLTTVGAWFEAAEKLRVQKASQEVQSPEDVAKPFVVWPGLSGEPMRAKLNELVAGSHRTPMADLRPAMDIFPTDGVLLLSASGDLVKGPREVQFFLIERATGKIAWQEKGSSSSGTPESFGKEARKLLAELPAAGQGKK